jgi:hypothetical protein
MPKIPLDDRLPGFDDPEQVRSWRLTRAAIFFLIAAGAIAWVAVDQWRAAARRRLARSGATIQGRVTELDFQRGGQVLAISYEFSCNGTSYVARKRPVGDFKGLWAGGPVTVSYDPSDPQRCVTAAELAHVRYGWTPYLFCAVIVVMMILAGIQAYQVLQPRREPQGEE